MPLDHGYAVLVGTLVEHHRDRPDDQGRWYHVNLTVTAAGTTYRVAVDVDSKRSATGVQWKTVSATPAELGRVPFGTPGLHPLAAARGSGALDHVRHPVAALFRLRRGPWGLPVPVIRPWHTGSQLDASIALEDILVLGAPVVVWGEPFAVGSGVHNVHQNQGDPVGSPWWAENGIWQDGGVATPDAAGGLRLFLPKFSTQAARTDDQGHPR
jgi:uncharacterized protein YukJ